MYVLLQIGLTLAALVVGWLLKSFFPSYFAEKGKNLATKEDIEEITRKIEQMKASVGSRLHIHQTRYDHEFKLLMELSEKLVTAREAATGLRPEASYEDVKDPEVKKRRYNTYIEAAKDLYLFMEAKQPFFPEASYTGLKGFDQLTWKEAVHFKHGDPSKAEYWDSALKAAEDIKTIASALLLLIRDRIQRWEKFDSGP